MSPLFLQLVVAPYGFYISGCIDGYSRRIMFLQVAATNHDPAIIAYYYLRCVKQIQGCPRLVKTRSPLFKLTVGPKMW